MRPTQLIRNCRATEALVLVVGQRGVVAASMLVVRLPILIVYQTQVLREVKR